MMKKINYFKMGLLLLGIIFLFIYYQNSQIGRYQFKKDSINTVIDTKTGNVYDGRSLEYFPK